MLRTASLTSVSLAASRADVALRSQIDCNQSHFRPHTST